MGTQAANTGRTGCRGWALLIAIGVFVPVLAQQSAPDAAPTPSQDNRPQLSHRPPPATETTKGKIQLDVTVTDGAGRPVPGLTRDQFTLLDNKAPRPILSFRAVNASAIKNAEPVDATEPPVEVILLVDVANTSFQRVSYVRFQVENFLRRNNGHLAQPTTLMVFSDQGVQAQPQPSTDGNVLAKAFDEIETGLHTIPLRGGYQAMERLPLSLKALNLVATVEGRKPGRKLLLWVGTGWPLLESPAFQLSSRARQSLFSTIVNTSRELREARITLDSIFTTEPGATDIFRDSYSREFLKAVAAAKDAQPGDLALPVLAIHSGGLALTATGDLGDKLAQCIAEAKAYYTLGFDPPSAEHADEYHAVQVKVAAANVQARTSSGYYAQPGMTP